MGLQLGRYTKLGKCIEEVLHTQPGGVHALLSPPALHAFPQEGAPTCTHAMLLLACASPSLPTRLSPHTGFEGVQVCLEGSAGSGTALAGGDGDFTVRGQPPGSIMPKWVPLLSKARFMRQWVQGVGYRVRVKGVHACVPAEWCHRCSQHSASLFACCAQGGQAGPCQGPGLTPQGPGLPGGEAQDLLEGVTTRASPFFCCQRCPLAVDYLQNPCPAAMLLSWFMPLMPRRHD